MLFLLWKVVYAVNLLNFVLGAFFFVLVFYVGFMLNWEIGA